MRKSPQRQHITSRDNETLKEIRKLLTSRTARRAAGLFLCDGRTLLSEALAFGADIVTVVCAEGLALPPLPDTVRALDVPEPLLRGVCPSDTPQGVVFTCRLPALSLPAPPAAGRHILLDRVQDPGNVGSILRSAAAFGVDSVILGPGCADPFSPKTIRAGMGACFRQPVFETEDLAALLKNTALPVYAAARTGGAENAGEAVFPRNFMLLLGNEGAGLSSELRALAGRAVWIPLRPDCESLGVAAAAAVLMFCMTI